VRSENDFVAGKNQIVKFDKSKSPESTQGKGEINSPTVSSQRVAEIKERSKFK
jgi:hypothetical protein